MASTTAAPTPKVASSDAAQEKQQFVRPEKPDEEKYKEELAKAEKAQSAAQEKFVRETPFPRL